MENNLFTYLMETSVVLLVLFGLYALLYRNLKNFEINRYYLLFIMLASLTIPLLSIDFYPIYFQMAKESAGLVSSGLATVPVQQSAGYDILSIAFMLYAGIALIFLAKLILDLFVIFRLVIKNSKSKRENIKIIVGNNIDGIFSFYKYIFCKNEEALNSEIFEHEKIHVQQGHTIDIILSELVKAILWFNPVIYFVQRSIKLNHEFICDEYASRIKGVDNYSQMMINNGGSSSRIELRNDFSMYIKKRLIMLFNKNENKRLWTYLLIVPMLAAVISLYSFDEYYIPVNADNEMNLDSIPELKIIKRYSIDTTVVFNSETYEEQLTVVRSESQFVEIIDTIVIFDSSTYEETVKIVKSEIPIEQYYKNRGLERLNDLNNFIMESIKKNDYRIDTISFLEYDSGVFIQSIVHKINKCYTFFWGDYAFSDSHRVSLEVFKKMVYSPIKMDNMYHKECKKADEYTFRIVFMPERKDPTVVSLNETTNKIHSDLLPDNYLSDSTKVFIEDIKVNGEKVLDGIVLTLY